MKRKIMANLLLVIYVFTILFSGMVYAADSQEYIILEDDFEGYSSGKTLDETSAFNTLKDQKNTSVTVVDMIGKDGKKTNALKVTYNASAEGASGGNMGNFTPKAKNMSVKSGQLIVNAKIKVDSKYAYSSFWMADIMFSGRDIRFNGEKLASYPVDRWFDFMAVYDYTTKNLKIHIDGTFKGEKTYASFPERLNARFHLYSVKPGAENTIYFDDVKWVNITDGNSDVANGNTTGTPSVVYRPMRDPSESKLIFRSGFENTVGTPEDAYIKISGTDKSVPAPNDWDKDFKGNPMIGNFEFQYDPGTANDRHAKIIDDPSKSGNKVLSFWMQNVAPPPARARIQANMYAGKKLDEFYYKYRWYVPQEFQKLESYPEAFGWMTIAEFWNDPGWTGSQYPFRMSLNLAKDEGVGKKLHLHLTGDEQIDKSWKGVWGSDNSNFELQYGKWMTVEIYFKEGDASNGKMYVAITPDGGEKQVAFALTALTHHPLNPAPKGLWLNPIKMYTYTKLVDYMRSNGYALEWYYDNFEFWDGFPTGTNLKDIPWENATINDPEEHAEKNFNMMKIEVENLAAVPAGASTVNVFDDNNLSGGKGTILKIDGVNNYVDYSYSIPKGSYRLKIGVKKGNDQGIVQMFTLGEKKGNPIDLYTAETDNDSMYQEIEVEQVSYTKDGAKVFRFILDGKNKDSLGSNMNIDYIKLIPVEIEEKMKDAIALFIGNSDAYVNNKTVKIDKNNIEVKPVVKDGRTLVPVRFISENIGAKVAFDQETSTITITSANKTIKMAVGSNTYSVNGAEKQIDVPLEVNNGRTLIPLRALVEALDKKVFWSDKGLIVISNTDILDSEKDGLIVDGIVSLFIQSAENAEEH